MKVRICLTLSLLVVVTLAATSMPDSALARKPGNNFARLAVDLARFRVLGILQGDHEHGVTFNAALTKQYGFPETAIRLRLG